VYEFVKIDSFYFIFVCVKGVCLMFSQKAKTSAKLFLLLNGSLGFYRGAQYSIYEQNTHNDTFPHFRRKIMYSDIINKGIFGLYINLFPPTFIAYTIPQEIYRLEVNLRSLEKNYNYYTLF
jgi:hypothetical protein